MPVQSYSVRRFALPSSLVGKGNFVANKLTQFFSLNPTISVVTLSCNWREGRSRSDTLYFNLMYRGGGSQGRMWATQFSANSTQTCEALAQQFFDYNPTYVPVQSVLLSRPDTLPRNRILLVIYATQNNVQVPCLLNSPVGAPCPLWASCPQSGECHMAERRSQLTHPGIRQRPVYLCLGWHRSVLL